MPELERVIQRLEADASGFQRGVGQAQASLRALDSTSQRTAQTTTTAMRTTGDAVQRTGGVFQNFGRFGVANASAQVQDFIIVLQAGQRPLQAFAQQGSQLLSAFGPLGVVAGTVAAGVAVTVDTILRLSDSAEQASAAADQLSTAQATLNDLLGDGSDSAEDLANRYAEMSDQLRRLTELQASQAILQANAALSEQREIVSATIGELRQAQREYAALAEAIALETPAGIDPGASPIPPAAANELRQSIQLFETGQISLQQLGIRVGELGRQFPQASDELQEFSTGLLDTAIRTEEAQQRLAQAQEQLELLRQSIETGGETGQETAALERGERELEQTQALITLRERLARQREIDTRAAAKAAEDFPFPELSPSKPGPGRFAGTPALKPLADAAEEARGPIERVGVALEGASIRATTLAAVGTNALFDFAEAADRPLDALLNLVSGISSAITQIVLFQALTAALGGGGASVPLFGGFSQTGGRTGSNRAYVVGEAGPELFVPDTTGEIIPNGRLSGGGGAAAASAGTSGGGDGVVINATFDLRNAGPGMAAVVDERLQNVWGPLLQQQVSEALGRDVRTRNRARMR